MNTMKSHLTPLLLAGAMTALLSMADRAAAWPMWDSFKTVNIDKNFRVIDYSDKRSITTSEGQSYAMFFALVADDRETFAKLLEWTEKNLSKGDITKNLPSWLWGKTGNGWGIIDTNNATDSDLWIAYDLLEAARLWNEPAYEEKARAMMEGLKRDVRDIPNLGKVLLPGGSGFDHPTHVTLNPSYYPVFILRRLALVDPYWKEVAEGTIRALVRTAPAGFSPDWAKIDKTGKLIAPEGEDYTLGSYNAIRVYLWAAMTDPSDPSYGVLMKHFDPMRRLTEEMNMPPEKVEILTGKANRAGNAGFGACVLEMLGNSKTADLLRTVIQAEPIIGENYYRNVLMLYGAGFDAGLFRFDREGKLVVSRAAVDAKPLPAPEKKAEEADDREASEALEPAEPAKKPAATTEAKKDEKSEAKSEAESEGNSEAKPESAEKQEAPAAKGDEKAESAPAAQEVRAPAQAASSAPSETPAAPAVETPAAEGANK